MRVLQFGPVLDVVAKKAGGMKEQGFVVFRDVMTAATAMRSLQVPHYPALLMFESSSIVLAFHL